MNDVAFPGDYDPSEYQTQKTLGIRTPSGELKLKQLKPIHKMMIVHHLRGWSNRDVASLLGKAEITVSRVLRDPLSQSLLKEFHEASKAELEALAPLAVAAVRNGLTSDSERTALAAADKFFKATGQYSDETRGPETAEDVIARALAIAQTQANTIHDLTRPDHTKIIDINPDPDPGNLLEDRSNGDDSDKS